MGKLSNLLRLTTEPVDLVDPFIGTDGTGHTFPGPSRPFGMVQPGPDNAGSGWAFTSGYQYQSELIDGFSQNRASGTGIPELGDVLLQPSQELRDSFESKYNKASERASAGYYAVKLVENRVQVELTSSLRTAFHRYQFEDGGRVWVLVDLQHGLTFLTDQQTLLSNENVNTPFGLEGCSVRKNWTVRTVAYSVEFDHPVIERIELPTLLEGSAPRIVLGFDLGKGRELKAKIGLSNTDIAGARLNCSEVPHWDFDQVKAESRAEWNELLKRATITAPKKQKRIFNTALYHAFLHPSVISDLDGRWRGPDGVIRVVESGFRYSTLSLWDGFRAAMHLYMLLVPERIDDLINTLLEHSDACGRLPIWTIWGGETGTMIGEPALPILASAWAKGFRGFDPQKALAAMVDTSSQDSGLSQWSLFDKFGYYPFDLVEGEAVSRTLEAGIGDDSVSRLAELLGEKELAERFRKRAGSWLNLIDPETKLARGRDSVGDWRTPFDPLQPTSPLNNPGDYTEGNAWQFTLTPGLFDPVGLIEALGGPAAFRTTLDKFFFDLPTTKGAAYLGQEAMIGQYAHGNEPSHHIAWLYAYTENPEIGHQLVHQITRDFYSDQPDGILGNEDAGQLSAWYIFATLGFYPAHPATSQYIAGLPLVKRARIKVPARPILQIDRNRSPKSGLKGRLEIRLNRQELDALKLEHSDLTAGGRLQFKG